MKTVKTKSLIYAMGCALFVGSTAAQASGNMFSGRAIVAQVKVLGIVNLNLVDTGYLPSMGGSLSENLAEVDFLGIDADLLNAKTSGKGNTAKSHAELANLDLYLELPLLGGLEIPLVGGLLDDVLDLLDVDASVIKADSKATCSYDSYGRFSKVKVSGSSEIADLTVLGAEIEAGGTNQIDLLGLVKVVTNEQKKSSMSRRNGAITVNALHITVGLPALLGLLPALPVAEVIVSSANSGITCGATNS